MTPAHLLLILIANAAWAFNFLAGKVGTAHFHPLFFTSLRFAVLLVLLLPFLAAPRSVRPALMKIGLVLGVGHFSFMFLGLDAGGDVSSIAIAAQLYVPFSVLMAAWVLKEPVGFRRWAGILLAFSGVVLIAFDPIVFNHPDALGLIVLAALGMAWATILMKRSPNLGVFRVQAWVALMAAPSLLLLSLIFERGQWQILQTSTLIEFWPPVYSAVGASILGHGIVYYLLGRYPVSVTAPLMLLSPILAVGFGVMFWGDTPTWKLLVGGALTLLGIAAINVNVEPLRRVLRRLRRAPTSL